MRYFILLSLMLFFAGCKEGPKLTICVMSGKESTLQCRDPKGNVFVLTPLAADNFVCLSPDDTEQLLNYCKRK